jgi:hypothetical protein
MPTSSAQQKYCKSVKRNATLFHELKLTPTGDFMTEEYFYNTAESICVARGMAFDKAPNYRNVVALRKFTPVIADNAKGIYDDRIWILWLDKKGNKRAAEFEGNTEPSHRYYGSEGQHANEDGKLDLGRLKAGAYRYSTHRQKRDPLGFVFVLTKAQIVERDINNDGDFTEADTKLITNWDAMDEKQTMHIHKGGKSKTDSAGCQTLREPHWSNFVANIAAGKKAGQQQFNYFLISYS